MRGGYFKGVCDMVFVTLGTQDKSFHRLLEQLDLLIDEGFIKEKVIVQAGSTKYKSRNMEIIDYIDMSKFNDYVLNCRYMISHGGVGSILAALNHDKKVIAVARRKKYEEHENDHQLEIVKKFNEKGYVIGCDEVFKLKDKLFLVEKFKPNKYISNNKKFCEIIKKFIDE